MLLLQPASPFGLFGAKPAAPAKEEEQEVPAEPARPASPFAALFGGRKAVQVEEEEEGEGAAAGDAMCYICSDYLLQRLCNTSQSSIGYMLTLLLHVVHEVFFVHNMQKQGQ